MTILTIILFIIKYGLPILSLVSEIWDLIKKLQDKSPIAAAQAKAELDSAVKEYKTSRDRRLLHRLRDRLHTTVYEVPPSDKIV